MWISTTCGKTTYQNHHHPVLPRMEVLRGPWVGFLRHHRLRCNLKVHWLIPDKILELSCRIHFRLVLQTTLTGSILVIDPRETSRDLLRLQDSTLAVVVRKFNGILYQLRNLIRNQ